jgi:hypothetical protein
MAVYNIPFDSETLKKIILGEVDSPEVNYAHSAIKGKNFITYFSNLKYKTVNIDFSETSFEQKSELVLEYIKHNSSVHIEQLEATAIKCIFYCKNYNLNLIDTSKSDSEYLQKSILTNEEIAILVENNKPLIQTLCDILDGSLLHAIKNLNAYKEVFGDFITNNIIVEKQEVGKTFVNLFQNETFNSHYYAAIPNFNKIKYFEHYFDRPIYSGKTIISYMADACVIFPMLKLILENKFTAETFNSIYEETHVTSV